MGTEQRSSNRNRNLPQQNAKIAEVFITIRIRNRDGFPKEQSKRTVRKMEAEKFAQPA